MQVAEVMTKTVLRFAWRVKLLFMGRVDLLRSVGARIGNDCEILTAVENFGSEPWLIDIGDRVTLSHGVKLITHDASTRLFRARHKEMNSSFGSKFAPIYIGSDVFIGMDAILLPGVKVGSEAIVGAGAVVTGDVPPRTVVVGTPAKVLMSLEQYESKCLEAAFPLNATSREELRTELTRRFYGEAR
jgi:acetyltransferase-like isoleucine patch superfamily enzyme